MDRCNYILGKGILCFGALLYCASTTRAAELILESEPSEAEVMVKKLSGGQLKRIGKSPLTIDIGKIVSTFTQEDTFVLEVNKRGYEPKRYILSRLIGADIKINVVLDLDNDLELMRQFDATAAVLFESLRKIRKKSYDSAIELLSEEAKKFPHLSIIPEMQGSAAYLKKDLNKASDYYTKAISTNPKNTDAYKMKLMLDKALGNGGAK